ncbi:hypothetical protein VCV18_011988 [Metarhizium anisopliae]
MPIFSLTSKQRRTAPHDMYESLETVSRSPVPEVSYSSMVAGQWYRSSRIYVSYGVREIAAVYTY